MPKRKSLIDLARECEQRSMTVESEGDRAQLQQIATQLKRMAVNSETLLKQPRDDTREKDQRD